MRSTTSFACSGPELTNVADAGHGTVIVFDEWWGYEGWEEHEAKAWREYAAAHPDMEYSWIDLGFGEAQADQCPSRALVIGEADV